MVPKTPASNSRRAQSPRRVEHWRYQNIAAKKWQCPCGNVLPITMGATIKAWLNVHYKGENHKDCL